MNEIQALVAEFDAASWRGERCAVATVVEVEGSSYRRPGARMLVSATGAVTGTISAGCLEADVVEHARAAIATGAARLVEYDTASTLDEAAWGLGLGCGGVVRVLVEPLAPGSLLAEALRRSCGPGAHSVTLATVYRHDLAGPARAEAGVAAGARLLIDENGDVDHDEQLDGGSAATIERAARAAAGRGDASTVLACDVAGGVARVLVETLLPPVPLVVFGAGPDVLPVIELARACGWRTEVVDPQARPASVTRFAAADRVTLARPGEIPSQVVIPPGAMALLMSHDYAFDREMLGFLLASPARYIGVMGPRHRTERMLRELAVAGGAVSLDEPSLARLHAPAGLDIGANGPAEIALSIVAEMRAVVDGRRGGMLRERSGSIHDRPGEGDGAVAEAGPVLTAVAA